MSATAGSNGSNGSRETGETGDERGSSDELLVERAVAVVASGGEVEGENTGESKGEEALRDGVERAKVPEEEEALLGSPGSGSEKENESDRHRQGDELRDLLRRSRALQSSIPNTTLHVLERLDSRVSRLEHAGIATVRARQLVAAGALQFVLGLLSSMALSSATIGLIIAAAMTFERKKYRPLRVFPIAYFLTKKTLFEEPQWATDILPLMNGKAS